MGGRRVKRIAHSCTGRLVKLLNYKEKEVVNGVGEFTREAALRPAPAVKRGDVVS